MFTPYGACAFFIISLNVQICLLLSSYHVRLKLAYSATETSYTVETWHSYKFAMHSNSVQLLVFFNQFADLKNKFSQLYFFLFLMICSALAMVYLLLDQDQLVV